MNTALLLAEKALDAVKRVLGRNRGEVWGGTVKLLCSLARIGDELLSRADPKVGSRSLLTRCAGVWQVLHVYG